VVARARVFFQQPATRYWAALLILLGLVLAVLLMRRPDRGSRLAGFPKIVLWAWERPEDLRFIDPGEVGVAFLAATVYLRGAEVIVRPRLQPLQVSDGTALMAVVRVESDRPQSSALANTVEAVAQAGRLHRVSAVQVDFDARLSERPFYRRLLGDLRRRLPESQALSITALVSWCLDDDWLSGLPIDEAVPMLFRLGPGPHQGEFRSPVCRGSVGISTDETVLPAPSGGRLYVFHPRAWSPEAFERMLAEVRK